MEYEQQKGKKRGTIPYKSPEGGECEELQATLFKKKPRKG